MRCSQVNEYYYKYHWPTEQHLQLPVLLGNPLNFLLFGRIIIDELKAPKYRGFQLNSFIFGANEALIKNSSSSSVMYIKIYFYP